MGTWREEVEPGEKVLDASATFSAPNCGTVACIGGWALIKAGIRVDGDIFRKAGEVLGLSVSQRDNLFLSDQWPEGLGGKFEREKSPVKRAQLAAQVIDKVIATDGAILDNDSYKYQEEEEDEELFAY